MARKMRKFSEGGAQGKYDRRMADIEKDFKKGSAGKSGKALEVLEAKRAQRKADAEDDRAKRTGADRTATRAAEKAAESNLTKTRKYGAAKSVSTEAPAAKVTDSLPTPKMDSSIGAKPAAKKPAAKSPTRRTATPPRTDKGASASSSSADKGAAPAKAIAPSKFDRQAFAALKAKMPKPTVTTTGGTALRGKAPKTDKPVSKAKPLTAAQRAALVSANRSQKGMREYTQQAPTFDVTRNPKAKSRDEALADVKFAKGGKIMKYAKGGSTPPQPNAAERKAGAKFRESIKDIKPTPAQGKILDKTGKKLAKGGKAKAKGNPFAATKFGAAMMKKSADTKGRAMTKKACGGAMKKYAKGGSIDGCAVKGKTKGKMV